MKLTKKFLLFLFIFLSSFSILLASPADLTVHFLDVGQGDSIFVQTPNQNVLIDGGDRSAGSTEY